MDDIVKEIVPIKFHKPHRLKGYDYSSVASYLLTFNTKDRKRILSKIHSNGIFSPPVVQLLPYGNITEKYILQIEKHYHGVVLENYVIMPDHVHLLISIERQVAPKTGGHSTVSKIVQSLKSLTSKEIGHKIWQLDYYDVIAETEAVFLKLDEYIDNNPSVWIDKSEAEPYFVK